MATIKRIVRSIVALPGKSLPRFFQYLILSIVVVIIVLCRS